MAHGAGAGMAHPFMATIANGLGERGIATLRYQFPYMDQGSKRPDTPTLAQATVRAAVAEAAVRLRLLHQRLVRPILEILAPADQQRIAPCPHRLHRRLLHGIAGGDGGHLQIIGEQHPLESDLRPQQAPADGARQRGGHARVERLADDVRRHQRCHARSRRRPERA